MKISDDIIAKIKSITPDDLELHGVITPAKSTAKVNGYQTYLCPSEGCTNGTGKAGDGIVVYPNADGYSYHCFTCKKHFDNINLLAQYYKLDSARDFPEIVKRACDEFSIYYADSSTKNAPRKAQITRNIKNVDNQGKKELQLIRSDIERAKIYLPKFISDCGGTWRGLKLETLQKFGCGYLKNWVHPKNRVNSKKLPRGTARVIIPTDNHYLACMLAKDRNAKNKHWWKMHAGTKELFGSFTIKENSSLIVAFEGEIDAMSFLQATGGSYPVVATCSASGYELLLREMDKITFAEKPQILIVFDNDEGGVTNSNNLRAGLIERGFPCAIAFLDDYAEKDLYEGKIDANAILQKQGDEILAQIMAQIIKSDSVNKQFTENVATDSDKIAAILKQLIMKKRRGLPPCVAPIIHNYDLIFKNDPNIAGLFGNDEFQGVDVFLRCPTWRSTITPFQPLTDSDDSALRIYLKRNYADIGDNQLCADVIKTYAQENSFHPIKQWFEKLPSWDGTKRAETFFIKFLRIEDNDFARAVTFKWLLGAVARIYYPGCTFQTALILKGRQFIGKSYLLEKLGGTWYGCLSDSVDDPHAIDSIQRIWICEIKEFSAARKADVNTLKSFVERGCDIRRFAYERRASTVYRQCVFAATVNDEEFLRDMTGNRRFWILESQSEMFDIVEGLTDEYILQIWAEMYHCFKSTYKKEFDRGNFAALQLPAELKIHGEQVANKFMLNDGLAGEIEAFLDIPILPAVMWRLLTKEERRNFFSTKYITLERGDWEKRKDRLIKSDNARALFEQFLENEEYTRHIKNKNDDDNDLVAVYGSVPRMETCASEIYNECFGNDRRKSMIRINEILATLSGWTLDDMRRKNFADCYGDQKKIFIRKAAADEIPT